MMITYNIAVDMIYEALAHYKWKGRKVQTVNLSHSYWRIFSDYMKKQGAEEFTTDGIQFNNVLIRRGSAFMRDNIEFIFYKTIANA